MWKASLLLSNAKTEQTVRSFSIHSANLKKSFKQVALKIIDLEGMNSEAEESLLQEVQTMRLASNPNLLTCHCSFVATSRVNELPQLYLVTQYMNRG